MGTNVQGAWTVQRGHIYKVTLSRRARLKRTGVQVFGISTRAREHKYCERGQCIDKGVCALAGLEY
jgi:hypothetical protein